MISKRMVIMRQKMRIIDISRDLTSYDFYSNVLPRIVNLEDAEIILDMSNTKRIEPLVVPNLLCLAFEQKMKQQKRLTLSIPDTVSGGMIRHYLYEIGFIKYAYKFDLYDFQYNPYGGMEGKHIDPICGTFVFDVNDSKDMIYRGVDQYIAPFSETYLSRFQKMDLEHSMFINEITEFLEEILLNCKVHAKSFSITTLHANYSSKRIYIAVSDVGCGFLKSIGQHEIKDEQEAIFQGVYKRKDSKIYGLYNVIRRVIDYGGKVRIHSNNTQIIFTPRIREGFINNKLQEWDSFKKYNVKNTAWYDGVHIEMEMPLEKGNRGC